MMVQTFTVGKLFTNCYVAACQETREAIIIDPGFENYSEAEKIFGFVKEKMLNLKFIVNTHGHPDHVCGNGIIKEKFNTPILIHEKDAFMLGTLGNVIAKFFGFKTSSPPADFLLRDGDAVKFGNLTLKVLHTPGHSPGSISLVGEKEVFTGDTLFAGSIGRTDLPRGSEKDMKHSLEKLASLPEFFSVYPGHGPTTTIGEEKRSNLFLPWSCRQL
ncbi:MAG: MBL fold metallo-hydrolase [Candidatus Bathyarchaeota archaeon]|nr:MBL fold metallo-hydrolase [Candidatus Bathyarchaeota archaeon]MDW8040155.1 MBL fold metallo-hydrolase [Nitrososphaerota archaeon]